MSLSERNPGTLDVGADANSGSPILSDLEEEVLVEDEPDVEKWIQGVVKFGRGDKWYRKWGRGEIEDESGEYMEFLRGGPHSYLKKGDQVKFQVQQNTTLNCKQAIKIEVVSRAPLPPLLLKARRRL